MLLAIGMFIAGLFWALALWIAYRNHVVFSARQDLLNKVYAGARRDTLAGRDWSWRYRALESVTYEEMMFSLQKPEALYDNLDFVK